MRLVAGLLVLAAAGMVRAQTPSTCAATGSVVDSVNGAPISRARVSVGAGGAPMIGMDTDAGGRWSAQNLACGPVFVSVSRPGYLPYVPPGGLATPSVVLSASVPSNPITLKLTPQAVLLGRITDDQGDPVPNAQVTLLTSMISNGSRALLQRSSMPTNDLGEYRMSGLVAGKYILCASSANAVALDGGRTYGRKCYPGPPDVAGAPTLALVAGSEERINLTLIPESTAKITGTITGIPNGARATLTLVSRVLPGGAPATVNADGTFLIRNVPAGSYTLTAYAQGSTRLTDSVPLEISGADVDGVQLHLSEGATITGTLKIASAKGAMPNKSYTIVARGVAPGNTGNAIWNEDRSGFTISGLAPGNYRFDIVVAPPFYAKSAYLDGASVLGGAQVPVVDGQGKMDVLFSDDGGSVQGHVTCDSGTPCAAGVMLQSGNTVIRNIRTGADGSFKIDNVPPGSYTAYAWDDPARVEYANADWMQHNAKGTAVTVDASQSVQVELIRQPVPPE